MFHELLMALNGIPGSIFFNSSDGIKVSPTIPHLHPGEKNILERLCSLGSKYKFLSEFFNKYKYHSRLEKNDVGGLYLKSFCNGVEEVLVVYRQDLINIEEELLKDSFLPLTHFLRLEKYDVLFQVLIDIVSEIMKRKVHGCQILDIVFKHSSSGVQLVEVSMNKILQRCHSVMFRQVFFWMLNGCTEDPVNEFFIQPEMQMQQNHPLLSSPSEKNCKMVTFSLKPELLPSYIPSSLAAKILFVGEYVSILKAAEDSESYSLFLKKEHIFSKKIEKLLARPSFSLLNFEATIDDIRRCAAEHLWRVIVQKANVVNHLKIIKDFFLLGRGELFYNFTNEANQMLRMPVTITAENDASKLFHTIALKIFPDDDHIIEKFRVTFQSCEKRVGQVKKESISKAKLESGWSSIGLQYDVPSPLHILITPSAIDKYNTIFRFLLSVRKVQVELHQCWSLQMSLKNTSSATMMPFQKLRTHMSFLIDNLQYYILVDVLESRFNNLLEKVGSVEDFEEIQLVHDRFLSSVISQCFLEMWTVHHSMEEILEICSSFCSIFIRMNFPPSQKESTVFDNINQNFQRQTSLLFRILSGVRSHQVSPHLAQLLLRIDYNKYLTSCGGQLG